MTIYRPSTSPGKTWGISLIKQPKRPWYFTATEGDFEQGETGFSSFSFVMFQARTFKGQPVAGPATKAKVRAAFAAFLEQMTAAGLIAPKGVM